MRYWLAFVLVAAACSAPQPKPAPMLPGLLHRMFDPPRREPAGRIMDKASMEVMYSSYNDTPNDPCGAVIDRVPFEVISHRVIGGGLNLYWDRRTFVLEWPRSSILAVSLFERTTPAQTYLGPWWLSGGSIIDPEGLYRQWTTAFGDKWKLRIPETIFPIGLEFSIQALLDSSTSDSWRIAVR